MLREEAIGLLQPFLPRKNVPLLIVINTLNRKRSGMVIHYIDNEIIPPGCRFLLRDSQGRKAEVQSMSRREDGTYWAIWAENVPSLGYKSYSIHIENGIRTEPASMIFSGTVENDFYRIEIDTSNCSVISLLDKELNRELIDKSDAVLILSCGAGANALSDLIEKPVLIGLNTKFLGTTERIGTFHEYCSMCGNCLLNYTFGICPVTRCPKGLANGPCGGAVYGKCEVDNEMDCIWVVIYERLEKMNALDRIKNFIKIRKLSRSIKPNDVKK